eukprot:6212249-Pleurochrysis_carterae.AAC.3
MRFVRDGTGGVGLLGIIEQQCQCHRFRTAAHRTLSSGKAAGMEVGGGRWLVSAEEGGAALSLRRRRNMASNRLSTRRIANIRFHVVHARQLSGGKTPASCAPPGTREEIRRGLARISVRM